MGRTPAALAGDLPGGALQGDGGIIETFAIGPLVHVLLVVALVLFVVGLLSGRRSLA